MQFTNSSILSQREDAFKLFAQIINDLGGKEMMKHYIRHRQTAKILLTIFGELYKHTHSIINKCQKSPRGVLYSIKTAKDGKEQKKRFKSYMYRFVQDYRTKANEENKHSSMKNETTFPSYVNTKRIIRQMKAKR